MSGKDGESCDVTEDAKGYTISCPDSDAWIPKPEFVEVCRCKWPGLMCHKWEQTVVRKSEMELNRFDYEGKCF
jgi:hypothetical protein